MSKVDSKIEVRSLKDGDWFWINKAIIQKYTQKVRATGIAVYNFLASLADNNQSCFPSQKYIAEYLGYSRTTINKAINLLEENGLIRKVKKSRYHCIYHLLRCKAEKTQMYHQRNSDVAQVDTNDNKLTRIINNIDNKKFLKSNFNSFKRFKPKTRQELLALDLAEALNDRNGLPFYLSLSKKYPEALLRKVLGEVKEIPDRKIRKSRGALFNHLIQKYVQKTCNNHRD